MALVVNVAIKKERNKMQGLKVIKNVAFFLGTWGIVLPQTQLLGNDSKAPSKSTIKILPAHSILDVSLGKDGSLTGRTVNHNGSPVVNAVVLIKQGNIESARTLTDDLGNFAVKDLKSGVYQIQCAATVGTYRVWNEKAAPPSAKPHTLLVLGENGTRGQYGLTETIVGPNLGLILLVSTTGLALAATVIAITAERQAKDAQRNAAAALAKSP